jgi:hypothetical protein
MNINNIHITREITFESYRNQEVTPIEIYRSQITEWIFEPVAKLESDFEQRDIYGMAAFMVLLSFFEPHGKYLNGDKQQSQNSQKNFVDGYKAFREFLSDHEKQTAPNACDMYRWARCGLYHSATLNTKLLIDTTESGNRIFTDYRSKVTLVNTWRLKDSLQKYLNYYCDDISKNDNSQKAQNFKKTFNSFIHEATSFFQKIFE